MMADDGRALFGAVLRHCRQNVRHIGLRTAAQELNIHYTHLGRWERGECTVPADMLRALEKAYRTNGILALLHARIGANGSNPASTGTFENDDASRNDGDDDMERRAAIQLLATLGAGAAIPAAAVESLHSGLHRILNTDDTADDWERIAWDYAQGVWTVKPTTWIADLAADLRALENAIASTQPAKRSALLRVYATLAAILADETGHTNPRACRGSCRAAQAAADASGDRDLAVFVRAWEASQSFRNHRMAPATQLAGEAVELAAGRPCLGLARALEARSLILAFQQRADAAQSTLAELKRVHERLPDSITTDHISLWGMPIEYVDYTEAIVLAKAGKAKRAAPKLDQALAVTPSEKPGARANLGLMQAWGMVEDRDVTQGLFRALELAHPLPVTSHRRVIIGAILAAVPENARDLPAARELRRLVAAGPAQA